MSPTVRTAKEPWLRVIGDYAETLDVDRLSLTVLEFAVAALLAGRHTLVFKPPDTLPLKSTGHDNRFYRSYSVDSKAHV